MAIYNPLYNEETGWTPLDQLEPWQQALMNPGARGMSMPAYDQNLMSMLGGQSAGVNPGAGTGGSMMSSDPYTWTGPPNSGAGNSAFNNVFSSGTTQRPSQAAPVIGSPQLATNMSMTGAENVGGMGMYTGSNGPLDTTRFSPVQGQQQNGPPPGSIPTGDPNTWITPQGNTWNTPGSINNRTQAEYDAYRQRAYGDIMGPQGRGPQSNPYSELSDVLRQAPGSINAQTFQGYLGSLQGQQTGPYPPQQTAPLPPQNGGNSQRPGQPGSSQGDYPTGGLDPGPGQIGNQPGGRDFIADMYAQLEAQRQATSQREQQRLAGIQGAMRTTNPYKEQYTQQLNQRLAQLGLKTIPSSGMRTQEFRADPLGLGIDTRDIVMADGSPVDWNRMVSQYGQNAFSGWGTDLQRQSQDFYNNLISPYYSNTGELRPATNQSPVIGSPGMMGPGSGGMNGQGTANPYGSAATGPAYGGFNGPIYHVPNDDPYSQVLRTSRTPMYPGQQPMNSQQQLTQGYSQPQQSWSGDPGMNQARMFEMYGGGGGGGGALPQVDFRAATFGGGSLFPASAGGSGNTNIPNTTNPSTSQYSTPGWGGASNRRGGFGGMSLFGNQFGSGGSTGFGGTQPSQYRGAGSYGRPASYGQSQRPY